MCCSYLDQVVTLFPLLHLSSGMHVAAWAHHDALIGIRSTERDHGVAVRVIPGSNGNLSSSIGGRGLTVEAFPRYLARMSSYIASKSSVWY